jgi:hypothetical protein
MAINDEYYFLSQKRITDKTGYPTPSPNIIKDSDCPPYTREKKLIENPQRTFFCFGKGTSKSPRMLDYHEIPCPLVSDKIYSILSKMDIKGLQLIPATIRGKKEDYTNYWYMHIVNFYPALDREQSIYKWNDIMNMATFIEKIALNEDVLKKIKLEDRMVFRLSEDRNAAYFFHKTIVDAFSEVEGTFQFKKVAEYSD